MANPTTNYGWPMPTSADLVTDLPADFAAFGQPVDTSLKALNPETTLGDIAYRSATSNTNTRLGIGTNGQVLAVSGGVPAWTTTADVTPLTTKGDLFTFTTVDARIGVGANGTILTADSAEATGLKWAAPAGGGKVLQVVNQLYTTETTSSSGTLADTGITLNITPTSATSKILVLVTVQGCAKTAANTGNALVLRLLRGATVIGGADYLNYTNTTMELNQCWATTILDSPATTSATTYKVQFANQAGGTAAVKINYGSPNDKSTITLLEIGA